MINQEQWNGGKVEQWNSGIEEGEEGEMEGWRDGEMEGWREGQFLFGKFFNKRFVLFGLILTLQ